jgi:hypothetical protein
MRGTVTSLLRLAVLVGLIGLGVNQIQFQAHAAQPQAGARAEAAEVLVWQGKLLPVVTDIYASIGDLGTALNNRDVGSMAKVGDQFANEQLRFEAITPTPKAVRTPANILDQALRNMSNGTRALVIGERASDNAGLQRAAKQIVQGFRQFQQAVDVIRRMSGPVTVPASQGNSSAIPTPVIRGLP